MSHQNFNPKLYQQDDIQFKIVSKSYQQQPAGSVVNTQRNQPAENKLLQSIQTANHKPLNQVVIMNESMQGSNIFNDNDDANGIEPSINESIRQSIQCSFVSSEAGDVKQKYQQEISSQIDTQRNTFVMNRMNWITYLKVLFDQLDQFNQNKLKHVETANFLKGLKKIKNLLPLQTRNDYYKHCSEVAFTYKEVENGVSQMPKYITWDNVIDIFLTKQYNQSVISNPKSNNGMKAFKQIESNELYQQHPQEIDVSQLSDDEGVDFEVADIDHSYRDNKAKRKTSTSLNQRKQGSLAEHTATSQHMKVKRNENDLFPSFALDSFANHGNLTSDYPATASLHQQQQIIAQSPLLLSNPNLGLKDKDDDEACEIDSDYSDENDDEESKNQSNSRNHKHKLEESIRSSRTATFKSVRRTSTHNNGNQGSIHNGASGSGGGTFPHSQLTSALSAAINVQDSYYAAIKNSQMPLNYNQQNSSNQKYLYYQKQSAQTKNESRNSSIQYIDNDDGQVEVASNNSFGSQSNRLRSPAQNYNSSNHESLTQQSLKDYNQQFFQMQNIEQQQNLNEKQSTRISSLNSIKQNQNLSSQKNHQNQLLSSNNNTILSHNSSQSSHSQNQSHKNTQNNSKVSIGAISSSQNSQQNTSSSNFLDVEEVGKHFKHYEIKSSKQNGGFDKKFQLRSVNLAINELTKLPMGLEKSIQYMNLSYNKLKSLNGIEACINLKFLNLTGNQISSAQNVILLQSMRELVIAHNQISILKEVGQLKNLQLLDLSYNKVVEFEKIIPLQNLKKLNILSLQGNVVVQKIGNSYEQAMNKLLPQVKVLDPDEIKDFSQFTTMEHICFTEAPSNQNSLILVDQVSNVNVFSSAEKIQEKSTDSQQQIRPRSRTPNRDRPRSQLGQQQSSNGPDKYKSTLISPQRDDMQTFGKGSNKDLQKTPTRQLGSNSKLNNIQGKSQKQPAYNDQQFKLQSKYQSSQNTSHSNLPKNLSQKPSSNNTGASTQRNSGIGLAGNSTINVASSSKRERSYTNENRQDQANKREDTKSQNRERSTSDITRNTKLRNLTGAVAVTVVSNSGLNSSGKTQLQQIQASSYNSTFQSQNTNKSVKETQVKKISLNSNVVQKYGSQGKITPRRTNITTPRQGEKTTHYYKKSFCTEESNNGESSIILNQNATNADIHNTPSEKNTMRSNPLIESSDKKQLNLREKKDDIYATQPVTTSVKLNQIVSPSSISSKLVKQSGPVSSRNNNSNRPVTTLKQRMIVNKNDLILNDSSNKLINPQLSQMYGKQNLPQSTKNSNQQNFSHSFVLDSQHQPGRQTPTSSLSLNRPSSQLQKFITASTKTSQPQQTSQQQQNATVQSIRPNTTTTQHSSIQLSFQSNGQPSHKITNLPPKAYQTNKIGMNPGDKKFKADMGSNFGGQNPANMSNNQNAGQQQQQMLQTNSSFKNQSSILQTGGSFPEDSGIESMSDRSRSMSPVLEESNNIKKLKVDLTQYMNKQ